LNLRRGSGLESHMEKSRLALRQPDKWLISDSLLMATRALEVESVRRSTVEFTKLLSRRFRR
jgi:hypothetical protein